MAIVNSSSSSRSVINRVFADLLVMSTLLLLFVILTASVADGRNLRLILDQHQAAITNESIQLLDYIPDDDESKSLFDHQQQTEAFVMGSIAKAPNRACKSPKQMDRNGVCRDVWNLKGPNNKSTLAAPV